MTTAECLLYETELYGRIQQQHEQWQKEKETAPAEKHGAVSSMSTVNKWGYYGAWNPKGGVAYGQEEITSVKTEKD